MPFQLSNKIAAITGGGSGIGEATARLLAQQGATVAIIDYNETQAIEVAEAIIAAGGNAKAFACDVSAEAQVQATFQHIQQQLGTVELLVNSAGISHIGNITNTSAADFDRLFHVNVKGVFLCMQAAITHMQAKGKGAIVNLASIANNVGIPDRFAYSMTKGAVLAMTLSTARDMVSHGIRVNCISPGRVHTPFVDAFLAKNYPGQEAEMFAKLSESQPIGRMGTPVEMAHLILYLLSDEASFVTGANYDIDGGFTGVR